MTADLRSDVEAFVEDWFAGVRKLEMTDILDSTGCDGDDAWEFFEAFAKEFDVDLDGFPAYMRFVIDEPPNFRRVRPVDLDGRTVPFLPVTLDMLVEAVDAGRWAAHYPTHQLRVSRIHHVILGGLLLLAVTVAVRVLWL